MAGWTAVRVLAWREAVGEDLLDRVYALVMANLPPDHQAWRTIRGDAVLAGRIRGMLPGVRRRVDDSRDATMGRLRVAAAERALDPLGKDAQRSPRLCGARPARAHTGPSTESAGRSSQAGAERHRRSVPQPAPAGAPSGKPPVPLFQAPGTAPTAPTRGID
jgi:hypothetical protein